MQAFRGARRIQRALRRVGYSLIRTIGRMLYSTRGWKQGATLYPLELESCGWVFHDERWNRVIHRHEHRRALSQERSLTVLDHPQEFSSALCWDGCEKLSVNVPDGQPDRWVYLYLDPIQHKWRNFRWELAVARDSDFRELQFGFRYADFYNRYRFRHEDDHWFFDIVSNGKFYNSIGWRYSPMKLGREYHVVIQAVNNRFSLTVDGVVLLDEFDFANLFPHGSAAIILWEDHSTPRIEARLRNLRVVELRHQPTSATRAEST